MGLLDLKTDLKSLRYGYDQRGGGSSNQPYVVTPIPDGFAPTSPDFLLRNGYLNPINSLVDAGRLTKWFGDTKSAKGILFTAKQTLLERQNVKIPGGFNRIYNPAGTIAQAGVLSIGYHLNKQGLNPFARGYFNGGENGYYKFTQTVNNIDGGNGDTSETRLALLYKAKQINNLGNQQSVAKSLYGIDSNSNFLFSYSGGPGSTLGIGNTNIRIIGNGYGNPRERTNNDIVSSDAQDIFTRFGNTGFIPDEPLTGQIKANKSTTLLQLNNTYNPGISNYGEGDPGDFNREYTYKTGNTTYRLDRTNGPNFSYTPDEINKLFITGSNGNEYNDLIKFYFEVINNDTVGNTQNSFLFFRAYINNLGDGFKADWQAYKYVGRAENFYKYGGFSRDISLSFTIYAHSRAEMLPIYQKLNYLIGTTAPSYSEAGLMRGNFIRMTVGDYLNDVPCIIQSINLKPSFEAGWDINRKEDGTPFKPEDDSQDGDEFVGQLPRMIEVDLSFIPIHTFPPQIGKDFIRNTI